MESTKELLIKEIKLVFSEHFRKRMLKRFSIYAKDLCDHVHNILISPSTEIHVEADSECVFFVIRKDGKEII